MDNSDIFKDIKDLRNTENVSELRRIQYVSLWLLEIVDAVCKKYKITYWLDGGTILGAVRHKGFIPWDDDIDIAMPIDDFNRFLQIMQKEILPTGCVFENDAHRHCAKVRDLNSTIIGPLDYLDENYRHGVYLDIFPMIPCPKIPRLIYETIQRQYVVADWCKKYKGYFTLWSVFHHGFYLIAYPFLSFLYHACYFFGKSKKYYGNIPHQNIYWIYHKFENTMPVSSIEFEGKFFSAPHDSSEYCRELYGDDYMTPPPLEKQHYHGLIFDARKALIPFYQDTQK